MIDNYIDQVKGLALLDAAYLIWANRLSLDQHEFPIQADPSLDLNNPKVFRKLIAETFSNVINSRNTAHDGPTFHRLKYLYPTIPNKLIKDAIIKAVKFDHDCHQNFHYNSDSYIDDCKIAVAFAAAENTGFSEKTIALAEHKLMVDYR